ncbi:MAG: hypothetical protein WCS42_08935 [Verrucomicrobiota bacterium]
MAAPTKFTESALPAMENGGDTRFLAGARTADVQLLDAVQRDKIPQHLAVRDGCRRPEVQQQLAMLAGEGGSFQ